MPEPQCRVETLARVTAAAFGQRRKMLRSSLKQLTAMPELLLREAGIAPERRAEELTVSEFAELGEHRRARRSNVRLKYRLHIAHECRKAKKAGAFEAFCGEDRQCRIYARFEIAVDDHVVVLGPVADFGGRSRHAPRHRFRRILARAP